MPWVAEFLAQHAGIRIELDLSNAAHNLIEQKFDLAIRGILEIEPNLITRRLGSSPLLTCARPDYLARRGRPQVPMDLVGHDLLHFSSLRRGRVWTMTRGEERVQVPILPKLELNEGWALRTAALEGAGICQLPAFVIGDALRAGNLARVLEDWEAGQVPLHAVYPDNRLIAERVRAFVNFIARKAKDEADVRGDWWTKRTLAGAARVD